MKIHSPYAALTKMPTGIQGFDEQVVDGSAFQNLRVMAGLFAMDLHRELQQVAPGQANRMIFMTGGAFTAKARQFLSETPRENIEKPFDVANLRALVKRYVD